MFKVLIEGRQAAVLAPTTILVQQHYKTFRERLADYPFKVDFVSRFKSAADQKKTVQAVAQGEVDLIIGTHRLLSKDVRFKNLGLLIIDEVGYVPLDPVVSYFVFSLVCRRMPFRRSPNLPRCGVCRVFNSSGVSFSPFSRAFSRAVCKLLLVLLL